MLLSNNRPLDPCPDEILAHGGAKKEKDQRKLEQFPFFGSFLSSF